MTPVHPTPSKIVYLPKDCWSPRYDSTFYTVKMEGHQQHVATAPSVPLTIRGKSNLPAYYYILGVYREHEKKTIARRYSHFRWLYEQIRLFPPMDAQDPQAAPIHMPPGSCPFQWQNEAFAKNRQEELAEFLDDVLQRPGYASHPAVLAFLELEMS
jgi:hypothetical protein